MHDDGRGYYNPNAVHVLSLTSQYAASVPQARLTADDAWRAVGLLPRGLKRSDRDDDGGQSGSELRRGCKLNIVPSPVLQAPPLRVPEQRRRPSPCMAASGLIQAYGRLHSFGSHTNPPAIFPKGSQPRILPV